MTPKEIKKIIEDLKPQEDIVEIKFRGYPKDSTFAVVEKITGNEVVFCMSEGTMPEDFYPRYTVYGEPLSSLSPQNKGSIEIVEIRKVKSSMLVCFLNDYQKNLKKRSKQQKEEYKDFFSIIRG